AKPRGPGRSSSRTPEPRQPVRRRPAGWRWGRSRTTNYVKKKRQGTASRNYVQEMRQRRTYVVPRRFSSTLLLDAFSALDRPHELRRVHRVSGEYRSRVRTPEMAGEHLGEEIPEICGDGDVSAFVTLLRCQAGPLSRTLPPFTGPPSANIAVAWP